MLNCLYGDSMPCSCIIPIPDFPTNCEWGPIVWRILHGLADKYGRLMSSLYAKEEEYNWINFINNTHKILPCKECREHYRIYLSKNNPNNLKTSDDKKLWVQKFFFNLHNEINLRNDKPLYLFDDLHDTYKSVNFFLEIKHFEKLLKIVFRYNEVTYFSWKSWLRNLQTLLGIYGL